MKRAATVLLVATALGMLAFRLAHLELAPFARDEPQFLAAAREQLRTGHWLAANPLFGNLGLRYGAASFWFYGVVQLAFGDAPRTALLAMDLVLTLACLALAGALVRLFDESAVFFAVLLAWMASSPYQFHWSRMAWDLTSNAAVIAAAAVLCSVREIRAAHAAGLGLLLGIALSTHPSVSPFVIAVFLVLLVEWRGERLSLRALASLAGTCLLVCLPYLLYLGRARVVGRAPREPFSLDGLATLALIAPRITTPWRLEAFYDEGWLAFRAELGRMATALDVLAVAALAACIVATLVGLAKASSSGEAHRRRVARIGVLAWGGSVVLIAALGLARHAHYQFGAAWVPVFGVASCLAWLRARHPRAGAAALLLTGLVAAGQFAVILGWTGYLGRHEGTRTPAYGTTLGAEETALRTACARPEPVVVLQNETAMYRFPFEYLATTEAECRGKQVVVCAAPDCPAPAAGLARLELRYAGETGGALRVVPPGGQASPP